ncbi:ABC transporter substrate-binding protein, partial [bacterium]|nr:ABC transporter substrate-binding protein [bacterium]
MNQQQQDPGWVGWKSIVLGIILLYFLKPFGTPVQQVAAPTQEVADAVQKTQKDVGFLASVLSKEKRQEILTSINWETNENYELDGDPRAKKGGKLRMAASNFPATIRTTGKDSSDTQVAMIESLVYQTLVGLSADPFYFYPQLATHWAMSGDKMTYYFRIDSDAKWSDGNPVVAADVVASWDLYSSKDIQDPATNEVWSKFLRPVILDDRTVMVKAKELHWRNFMTFASSFFVLPSHILSKIEGKKYMKKYNWKMLPGSGPYILDKIDKPNLITFKRRKDFWGIDKYQYTGLYNFDKFEYMFVRDQELVWEKFKKGEFDYMPIYRSHRWVKETSFDKIQKGWIQKRKVFNRKPKGTQGFSFNQRKWPFNDIKIREAFAYLWNRGALMEKLMFNEYIFLDSHFQNSPYMGKKIPKVRYNPDTARELLAEAGWKELNSEGWLEKDGEIFQLDMNYVGKWSEKFYTVFQEDLKNVGIKLNLKEITWATKIKEVNDRSFALTTGAYTGSSFPNPEVLYHSKFADVKNSGNRWGVKNKRVDELCENYNAEFDYDKRVEMLVELDDILTNDYTIAFDWFAPAERLVYWNKFGMPV